VEIFRGGAGNDTLTGGAGGGEDLGVNIVDYQVATGAVTVNLATNSATGADGNDSVVGMTGALGSESNDSLVGDALDNYFEGRGGNDTIDGGAGLRDVVSYQNATAGVSVSLATGMSGGGAGVDTILNTEDLRGSELHDTLTGSDGDNRIQGRAGNDSIVGGAGVDSIHGGFGNDTLTGGTGSDVFLFGAGEGVDEITDYTLGDVLRINALLVNSTGAAGTGASVTGKTMQVSSTGGKTTLFVDTDNIAGADVTVVLNGTYSATSFAITNDAANGVANITRVPNGTGGVTIHGTVAQGQTIFLNHSLADADGLGTVTYQWMANGTNINGATGGTLLLTEALVGQTISVRASYTDATGIAESKTSASTAPVQNVNDAPVGAVSIAGNPVPGQTLTASNNLTDGDGMGAVAYQWIVNGAAVTVGTTYNFTESNIGNVIQAEAVYTDGRGTLERVRSGVYVGFGSGDDAYTGSALGDKLFGNVGSDTLTGAGGNDTIDGGGDTDMVVYSGARSAYTISTVAGVTTVTHNSGGADGVDTLTNVEDLRFSDQTFIIDNPGVTRNGTPGADQLVGTAGDDVEVGFAGNDYLYGGEGRDYLYGGDGIDVLQGEGGNDIILAEAGDDYLYGGTGHDAMYGGTGVNVYLGGGGNDTMMGGNGSIEYFYGEAGNNFGYGDAGVDVFVGEGGNDTFFGQGDNDYAYAGSGNDSLYGGDGVDVLLGQNGDDYFEGGLGTDYLFMGAAGNDTVVVNKSTTGVSLVYEFEIGGNTDQIRLQGTGWTSVADVQANSYDYESFSVIVLDADTAIWLIGARPAQFTAADFQFS
jgi:Ca2+-binding RTX toxin-like protein